MNNKKGQKSTEKRQRTEKDKKRQKNGLERTGDYKKITDRSRNYKKEDRKGQKRTDDNRKNSK